jgi:TPP-dependent pyruvate/acetoin dehydrogenase alpha subunit
MSTHTPQDADRLLALFGTMTRIRVAENHLTELFAAGQVPGFIHLSIGQEAVAAGVMTALGPHDTVTTTHRGHGHVIARGVRLDHFFKEVMGKTGANGIVAAGIPIALGSALAHRVRGTGAVAVAFFGDGALAEGVLHEALNLAALWKLPLILVCENNGWSEFSPTSKQFKGTLAALAGAFGLEYWHVDGNAQKYRGADEIQALPGQDPIQRARARLLEAGIEASTLTALAAEAEEAVSSSIAAARADGMPDFDAALADVYTLGQR